MQRATSFCITFSLHRSQTLADRVAWYKSRLIFVRGRRARGSKRISNGRQWPREPREFAFERVITRVDDASRSRAFHAGNRGRGR